MLLRHMRGGLVRSAQIASVVVLMVGCAAPGSPPSTVPTAAPPPKEQPVQPAPTAAVSAAPPPAAVAPPAQPGVSRLVMSVAPPGRESNDVRLQAMSISGRFAPCTNFSLASILRLASTFRSWPPNGSWTRQDHRSDSSYVRVCNSMAGTASSPPKTSCSHASRCVRMTSSTAGVRSLTRRSRTSKSSMTMRSFSISRAPIRTCSTLFRKRRTGLRSEARRISTRSGPPTMESGPLAGTGAISVQGACSGTIHSVRARAISALASPARVP